MDRRFYLRCICSSALLSLAGCTGSDDDADDDFDANPRDDLEEETVELADVMASTVDGELTFVGWRFSGGLFVPEFITEDGAEKEIPILGRAFADIVADGFEHESMPTALNEDEFIEYMVYIEPEWAKEYNTGELSEESYFQNIQATLH